jgi:DNA-directed RNA polymerase subunit H
MVKTKKSTSKPKRTAVKPVKKKGEAKVKKVRKVKSRFTESEFDVTKHVLVPKHIILSEKDKEKLLEQYKITIKELPKILLTDPAIQQLKPKLGDVVKIERESATAGKAIFYRGVVNE